VIKHVKDANSEPEIASPGSELMVSGSSTELDQVGAIEFVNQDDAAQQARALSDSELISKVERSFHSLREDLPYLQEAHARFARPGCRVPVPGRPTWTMWVKQNLPVGVRRIQQLLAEARPRSQAPKSRAERGPSKAALSTKINELVAQNKTLALVAETNSAQSAPTWQTQGERDEAIRYFKRHSESAAGFKHEIEEVARACNWRVKTLDLEPTKTTEDLIREEREHLTREDRRRDQEKTLAASASD
jgi:hypothetical protein